MLLDWNYTITNIDSSFYSTRELKQLIQIILDFPMQLNFPISFIDLVTSAKSRFVRNAISMPIHRIHCSTSKSEAQSLEPFATARFLKVVLSYTISQRVCPEKVLHWDMIQTCLVRDNNLGLISIYLGHTLVTWSLSLAL